MMTESRIFCNHGKMVRGVVVKTLMLLPLMVFGIITAAQAGSCKVPLEGSSGAFYHCGGEFSFNHPDVRYPTYGFHCDGLDEVGEECLSGGWRYENIDVKKYNNGINLTFFATEEEAQAALVTKENVRKIIAEKESVNFKKGWEGNGDEALVQSEKKFPVSGVDAGYLYEYQDRWTDISYSSLFEDKNGHPLEDGRSTCRQKHFEVIARKGRTLLSMRGESAGWCDDFSGKYYEDLSGNEREKLRLESENPQKHYQHTKTLVLEDIQTAIAHAPEIERAYVTFLKKFNSAFYDGRDFSEMSLAELVDLRVKSASPKSVKFTTENMDIRLAAMMNDGPNGTSRPDASMDPEFPDHIREWKAAPSHWVIRSRSWFNYNRKAHKWALKKKVQADSPFISKREGPSYRTIYDSIKTHYLYEIQKRLEHGKKLSDARQKRLRLALITYGLSFGLQYRRSHFYSDYPTTYLQRDSIFRILELTRGVTGIRDRPVLTVEAGNKKLEADGKSSSSIHISLFETGTGGNKIRLRGKTITLENHPYHGKAPGKLSVREIKTDANGQAVVTYMAPSQEEVSGETRPRAEIIVRCAELSLEETLYIDLYARNSIRLVAKHEIFPAHPDYRNEISFRFDDPEKDRGKQYKAKITVSSRHGRVASGFDGAGKRELVLKAAAVAENSIYFRWDGPQPVDKAIKETIKIEIPKLGISGTVSFSVGIDLAISSAKVAWKPPFQPYLTIPVKVFITDRLHPDADLGKLFEEFDIEPQLKVRQTGFEPPALLPAYDKAEDILVSSIGKFAEQSALGGSGAKYLTHDLVLATVKKTKQGQWLLMSKDLSGEGLTLAQAFPAFIPFTRGTYRVWVGFDPRFKGDAAKKDHVKKLAPIEVSRLSAIQGELEYFLLPTLKGVAGLTDAGGLAFGLTDIALEARAGNYRKAIESAGTMVAGKIVGDKLSAKMKAVYKKAMNAFYKKRIAEAFGTTVEKLLPRQRELALRLAYPYKLAKWVETLTGWTVGQKISDMSAPFKKDGLLLRRPELLRLLTRFASLLIAPAHAGSVAPADLMDQTLDYLKVFIKGYGDDYNLLVITRAGLKGVRATDQQGRELKSAPKSVFGGKDSGEMLVMGKNVIVIPYRSGGDISVDLQGNGPEVQLISIQNGKTGRYVFGGKGHSWKQTIQTRDGKKMIISREVHRSRADEARRPGVLQRNKNSGRIDGERTEAAGRTTHLPAVARGETLNTECGEQAKCNQPPDPVLVLDDRRENAPPKPPASAKPVTAPDIKIGPDMLAAGKNALDLTFWTSIEDSNNPVLFKAYLKQFPNGTFAVIAREKLKSLKGTLTTAPASATAIRPAMQATNRLSLTLNGLGSITGKTPFKLAAIRKALPGYEVKKIVTHAEGMTEISYRVKKSGKLVLDLDGDAGRIFTLGLRDRSIPGPGGVRVGDTLSNVMKKLHLGDCMGGYDAMANRVECSPRKNDDIFSFGFALENPLPPMADGQALTADMLPKTIRLIHIEWRPRDPETKLEKPDISAGQ